MSRRNSFRQPYHLDSGELTTLSRKEVALVLRAAEDLITTGGRTFPQSTNGGVSMGTKRLDHETDQRSETAQLAQSWKVK